MLAIDRKLVYTCTTRSLEPSQGREKFMEARMRTLRAKSIAAISVTALLGAVAFSGSTVAQAATTKTITVWLMPDAKDFGTALADANAAFTAA